MKKLMITAIAALSGLLTVSALNAQENAPAAGQPAAAALDAQGNATAAAPSSELQAFNDVLLQYKEKLTALRNLKTSYQQASPEQRDAILADYKPLVAETEALQKSLVPYALKAYAVPDGKDGEVLSFLIGIFEWMVISKENYETAFQIADALIPDRAFPDNFNYLYAYAAFAAFNIMELDKAQEWYELAEEKNALADVQKYDVKDQMHIAYTLKTVMPEYKKLWAKEKAIREKEAAEDNLPRVCLHTTKGDIVPELFLNEAPQAVGNFMSLVASGFYTDVPFHRVLPFFMAQGGDPTGTGSGGPGYCIRCECRAANARKHFRGSISMAHAGKDTGGSQFFLTFVPTGFLNGVHTVFGRIIEGMDVLSELQRIDPEGQNLPAPDKIVSAEILRGEPTPFEKLPPR